MNTIARDWLAKGHAHYAAEQWNVAGDAFEHALALDERQPDVWYRLGNVRQEQGRDQSAAECFERAVALDPSHARAWNNLGVTRQKLGHDALAAAAYRMALEQDGALVQAVLNLAGLASNRGDDAAAASLFERTLALDPSRADAWYALGRARQRLGRHEPAIAAYLSAIENNPALARPYIALGEIAIGRGERTTAETWLRAGLERQPGDPVMVHMLNAVRGETTLQPPQGYVAAYFDRIAHGFDRHLVRDLDYRVPEALARTAGPVLHAFAPARVIDLGCGTGLVGAALHSFGAHIVGVDLSAEMLQRAARRAVYARLVKDDVLEELRRTVPGSTHAILAADVFIYLGDLEAVFEAVARALAPGGLFAFSAEENEIGDYRLLRSGRYAHAPAYLRTLAARCALSERTLERMRLRREGQGYAEGWLACFAKPSPDA